MTSYLVTGCLPDFINASEVFSWQGLAPPNPDAHMSSRVFPALDSMGPRDRTRGSLHTGPPLA